MAVLFSFRSLLSAGVIACIIAFSPSLVVAQSMPIAMGDKESEVLSIPGVGELKALNMVTDTVAADSSISIAAPSVSSEEDDEDVFFDAEELVPQGEMVDNAPVKIDPRTRPGSRWIIVKENFKADTKTAQLVSAERAMALGLYGSALLMFDELYKKNKSDARILMGRAAALQKLERFDDAMGMYEALSKVDSENVNAKINMLGLLGTRYPSVALRRLLDLHKDNASHVGLTAQIAIIAAKTGDTNSAIRYMGIAASMEPNNASHVFNMAIISDRAGKSKQAITYYEKALEIDTIYGAGRSIPRGSVYERLAEIR